MIAEAGRTGANSSRPNTEGGVLHEVTGLLENAIKRRVLGFFAGANPTLIDGTMQQVGVHQVTISRLPLLHGAVRIEYKALSNGIPLANYMVMVDPSGNQIGDVYSLYGKINEQDAELRVVKTNDEHEPPSIVAELPSSSAGSQRKIDASALTDADKTLISQMFSIQF